MTLRLTPPCTEDGPTLTSTEPASCRPLCSPLYLPRSYWTPGKKIRIDASGSITTLVARGGRDFDPGFAQFLLYFGDTLVWDGGRPPLDPNAVATAVPWALEAEIRCKAVAAGVATFDGVGVLTTAALKGAGVQPRAGASVVLPYRTAPAVGAGVDAFREMPVDLWYARGTSSPGGSLVVSGYSVREV